MVANWCGVIVVLVVLRLGLVGFTKVFLWVVIVAFNCGTGS